MKKLIIICSYIALLAACKEKAGDTFTVTGNITNAPGKKVFLIEIPYMRAQPIVVDSVSLDSNGEFTLKGMGKEEKIFGLAVENGPEILLVNDSRNIKVALDLNDYRNYTVKGSPASESLHTLFEAYTKKDSSLFAVSRRFDTLQKAGGNDSLLAVVRTARDTKTKELNDVVKDFISKSESPAARFYAIGLASRTIPPQELSPLINESVEKYKNHEGLTGIKEMIASHSRSRQPEYKLLNQPAPEIAMPDKNGKMISLSDYKGKFVLVDFWASWCGPCRKENPNIVAAYNKFKNKNFTILGVSLDEDRTAWLDAIAKDKLAWTHISDLKQWESSAVSAYGIEGIPFNVLLNPEGKIIASNLRGEALEVQLAQVLK